ncbi:MAG: radical SAM family heme chaperone HemW [Oscillospiraceae bacterium]|jgi:oxygen-independent coproporphyrinogen-3 oxidase|nr:radical SAM family heme chaperone HemW [Oscillospiraceae bacterium]
MNTINDLGLYIHIPFCKSKCNYCDFFSIAAKEDEIENYITHLNAVILKQSFSYNKAMVQTLYFGGGTPGLLSATQIGSIINTAKSCFMFAENPEITIELNPGDYKQTDFFGLANSGVNRLSIGLQSANDSELQTLGRRHTAPDAAAAVAMAQSAGIGNISLDLIIGTPGQTQSTLKQSIDFCVAAGVQHISAYILKIEENTPFCKMESSHFKTEDELADLYLFCCEQLESAGFAQYEISNFCRLGYQSRHNMRYWNLQDYLGIGPAGHSCVNGRRFYYPRSFKDFYAGKIVQDGCGKTAEEYIMMQLRLATGLNLIKMNEMFGEPDNIQQFAALCQKYEPMGLLKFKNSTITLTRQGFLVSNTIIGDFLTLLP